MKFLYKYFFLLKMTDASEKYMAGGEAVLMSRPQRINSEWDHLIHVLRTEHHSMPELIIYPRRFFLLHFPSALSFLL